MQASDSFQGQKTPSDHQEVKKKRRKKRHKGRDFALIPGVIKMILTPVTQQLMGAVVGENVSAEDPWVYVDKENFTDDLELREGSSEFLPIKKEILTYEEPRILIGLVPNDDIEREEDEFYVCTTVQAQEEVFAIIDKIRKEQEAKMNSAVGKTAKHWSALGGSEKEIADFHVEQHRALYEVEVTSKYPIIMKEPTKFSLRLVNQSRDGYIELLKGKSTYDSVFQKRLSVQVQAAAICKNLSIQTTFLNPTNQWTQYFYDTEHLEITEPLKVGLREFAEKRSDEIEEAVYTASGIDFCARDYEALIKNPKAAQLPVSLSLHQYMSFAEVTLCKNKMISSVSWHPFLTGIVAAAYSEFNISQYKNKMVYDDIKSITYNRNPVLIWSYVDQLKPKLILEAHREVSAIAYCPYDAGLIAGACRNGQIVLWDITDKLERVETEEILTPQQQTYRVIMNTLMSWMRNIKNIALIPLTAASDLQYSHGSTVTQITWFPPYFTITKLGQIARMPDGEHSYTFATSSLDGSVRFWALNHKQFAGTGEVKSHRRSRRLKRRPSALMAESSPLRYLHRTLRPNYIVNVEHKTSSKYVPVTSMALAWFKLDYKQCSPKSKHDKVFKLAERLHFEPIFKNPETPFEKFLYLGTNEGEFMFSSWDGYQYSSGMAVSEETPRVKNSSKYHDGPVVSVAKWPIDPEIVLTVGGKTFCIWIEDFIGKPILWRKGSVRYTYATWNTHKPTTFTVLRYDGNAEVWALVVKSSGPVRIDTISGRMLTGLFEQPIATRTFAVADDKGTLRIYRQLGDDQSDFYAKRQVAIEWFYRQKNILKDFFEWQHSYKERHRGRLQEQEEAEALRLKQEQEDAETRRIAEEEMAERLEKERAKLEAAKMHPPPGQYKQWWEEKVKQRELKRMNLVLLHNKQLDPKTLKEQQKPIKIVQREEEIKRKKMNDKREHAEKIFNEAVAMYFPHVLSVEPPRPKDPYTDLVPEELQEDVINEFFALAPQMESKISKNPFIYHFDWLAILRAGRHRRSSLIHKEAHKLRHLGKTAEHSMKIEPSNISVGEEEHEEHADIISI